MKKLSFNDYIKLRRLVYRNATPLIFTRWRASFENGNVKDVMDVLSCYQNEDGGFGHGLDANCLNPNSSPYITSLAISIIEELYGFHKSVADKNHPVLQGILKYISSNYYATEDGWLGMASIPSNNDYSHAPWFHFNSDAQPDVTDPKNITAFVLKYADKDSAIYQKVLRIDKSILKSQSEPDFANYNPAQFICWEPIPTDVVDSPDSPLYTKYKVLVDSELDGIIDRLEKIQYLPIPGVDNKADWLDIPQIISCYPSTCSFIIMQLEILMKFHRLNFTLPMI